MKKLLQKILLIAISLVMVFSFAACGDGSSSSEGDKPGGDGEFGITQRPNDLDEYEDLRPDRAPFEDNAQPDTGELTDHIYEFEEMNSAGSSRDKDHLCNAKSFVFSPDFSGNVALENIDAGVSFTLTLESDKEVRVPMLIGMNNMGNTLGEVLAITNNGHAVADSSAVIPSEGTPAEGAPGGYFNMVTVESAISLVEGTNRITFKLTSAGVNFDYVNIRTSAKLVNNTVPAWPVPSCSVVAEPGEKASGTVRVGCTAAGCTDTADRYLPALTHECYTVTEEDDAKVYSLEIMGKSFVAATVKESQMPAFPEDGGTLTDHFFQFENAAISGSSQNADHFCAADSAVFSFSFGGGFCLENTGGGTTFSFTVVSDKNICVPFVLRMGISYAAGKPLGESLIIKNNGDNNMADVSAKVPEVGDPSEVGDISGYFTMANASGKINLVQGENKIEITTRGAGMNLDYFNIRTSASLTDETEPYWHEGFMPAFKVTKAPTATEKGEMEVICPVEGCAKGKRTYDYLPELGSEGYIVENGAYYVELFGQKIKVADAA